jgi:hypothetical protein
VTQLGSRGHIVSTTPDTETRFDAVIRLRAPKSLETRLARIASRRVKRLPEISREALVAYVEREEQRLGLSPSVQPQPEAA